MKYLFFLLIPFLLIVPAYAEVGKNFDTEDQGSGIIKWTSHYDRIFDGDSWENYILTNDATQIKFESAGISFVFDKTNCDFKLYTPDTQTLAVDSYKFELMVDAATRPASSCDVVNLIQTDDDISFVIDRTEFQTLFELEPSNGLEWTHELDNNEGKSSTFTIIETCKDCNPISIDENKIDFGSYTLDTKNDIHGTVKETRSEKGDYIIEFEKTISDKEKLIIDPTFTSSNPTEDAELIDFDGDNVCEASPGAFAFTDASGQVGRFALVEGLADCARFYSEWDITTIPDTSTILDADFTFDIASIIGTPTNCDYVSMATQPTAETDANNWANIGSGTTLMSNDPLCVTAGDNKNVDLGSAGNTYIENQLGSNWVAIGVKANGDVGALDASYHISGFSYEEAVGTPDPTLTIFYAESVPDAVTDLTAIDIRPTAVDLDWSQPNLNGGVLSGYQINTTTPWSSTVNTVLVNNTGTSLSAYTVSPLIGSTQYSFRIGVWETEQGSKNMSGNVLNITTDFDPTGAFTVGTFNLTQTGTDSRPMSFERDDINNTALFLNVTYDDTVDLACDLKYKFANTIDTYTIFSNSSAGPGRVESPILFLDVDNEIIKVDCYDEDGSNATGRYLITQTAFPFLEHIALFRAGEYGTSGDFGALDMVTLIAIIISMVGLNRVNESVGLVFSIAIIGGLAVFGIIEWPTIMTASLVLIALLVIGSTRKE